MLQYSLHISSCGIYINSVPSCYRGQRRRRCDEGSKPRDGVCRGCTMMLRRGHESLRRRWEFGMFVTLSQEFEVKLSTYILSSNMQ